MKPAKFHNRPPQPVWRVNFFCVMLFFGVMLRFALTPVRVSVQVCAMKMYMGMSLECFGVRGREFVADPFHRAGEVQYAEQDQHQCDREFQREPDARRNYDSKKNNCGPDHQNRQGVPDSPQHADPPGSRNRFLAADYRRHRDHVIRIRRMAHPQEKPNAEYQERAGHKRSIQSSRNSRDYKGAARAGRRAEELHYPTTAFTKNLLCLEQTNQLRRGVRQSSSAA